MKLSRIAATALTVGALMVSVTVAQDGATLKRNRINAGKRAGLLDSKTSGTSIRASQLIGMNIENSQQKGVGEVNDIVLDARTGEIQYVAVTYGGFLGVGNKMFAVPFAAFEVRQDPDDPDDYDDLVLVLDVTEQQLEGAKGFDEDHWPNFADENFTNDLYRRYDVKRNRPERRKIDVSVGGNGVDVDVERK
jgi:sporulation protein YlmC with PRC-barrel domain